MIECMKRKAHKLRKAYRNSTLGRLNEDRIRYEKYDTNPRAWVRRRKHWGNMEAAAERIDERARELSNHRRTTGKYAPEPVLQMGRMRPKRERFVPLPKR